MKMSTATSTHPKVELTIAITLSQMWVDGDCLLILLQAITVNYGTIISTGMNTRSIEGFLQMSVDARLHIAPRE